MKVSIIGPTNIQALAERINHSTDSLKEAAIVVGKLIAKEGCELTTMFNYDGILELVGNAYKEAGGKKLSILYTKNNDDWEADSFLVNITKGDASIEMPSWHDLLHSLVTDCDIVICLGMSLGVFVEVGYIRWNWQEHKGARGLVGLKEFLPSAGFPKEVTDEMPGFITTVSIDELSSVIRKFSK